MKVKCIDCSKDFETEKPQRGCVKQLCDQCRSDHRKLSIRKQTARQKRLRDEAKMS